MQNGQMLQADTRLQRAFCFLTLARERRHCRTRLSSRNARPPAAFSRSGRCAGVNTLCRAVHKQDPACSCRSRGPCRTAAQRNYHDALFSGLASYVIAVGPAGTGKTHMAVQAGAAALLSGAAQRLIITRPVVTVGEDLGYLPGSINQKMEPYLVPILDLLANIWSADELEDVARKPEAADRAPRLHARPHIQRRLHRG